jgi:hypothetical protein
VTVHAGDAPDRIAAILILVSRPNARAEERRRTWTGGVARNRSEMESASTDFWLAMTPEDRIACVFEMWDEQMRLQDPEHEPSQRLQRATGGVRPRKG